jgi:hypothetical protein
MKLAETLLRNHYHPFVAQYVWWPTSRALLVALLQQPLEFRPRILKNNDYGWTPLDYISLSRSPLMWEPDQVCAYTEPSASTGSDPHAGDISV